MTKKEYFELPDEFEEFCDNCGSNKIQTFSEIFQGKGALGCLECGFTWGETLDDLIITINDIEGITY